MSRNKCFELKLNNLKYTASLSNTCRDGQRYVTIIVENMHEASVTMPMDMFRLMVGAINRAGLMPEDERVPS